MISCMCSLLAVVALATEQSALNTSSEGSVSSSTHQSTQSSAPESSNSSMQKAPNGPYAAFSKDSSVWKARWFADLICWQRNPVPSYVSDGIGFTIPVVGSATNVAVTGAGSTHFTSFGYQPGFDVGFIFDLCHGAWDLTTKYTWIKQSATNHFQNGSAWEQSLNFLTEINSITAINAATQGASLIFNLLQFQVGSTLSLNELLVIRPNFGVVGLCMPSSIHCSYDYYVGVNNLPQYKHTSFSTHGTNLGVGGVIGVDTTWKIARNWDFIANASFMPLWSHHSINTRQRMTNISTGQTITNLLCQLSYSNLTYLQDFFLGLDWHMALANGAYQLTSYLGWEFLLGALDAHTSSASILIEEDINFQGIKFGFDFGF